MIRLTTEIVYFLCCWFGKIFYRGIKGESISMIQFYKFFKSNLFQEVNSSNIIILFVYCCNFFMKTSITKISKILRIQCIFCVNYSKTAGRYVLIYNWNQQYLFRSYQVEELNYYIITYFFFIGVLVYYFHPDKKSDNTSNRVR